MAINFPDSPTNGQTHAVGSFTWQYDGEKWVAANSIALDGLSDVTAPTPTSGDFLKWNGTAWVNDAIDLGTDTTGNYVSGVSSGTGISVSHTPSEGSTATVSLDATLDNLSNVTVPSPTTNDVLQWNGTAWVNVAASTVGATNLDGLTDVVITTPEEFQTLEYNGTNWVNAYASTVTYVRNVESTTITTGTCVYLFGATGDHATVKRADNSSDATSSKTIGVAGANITASNNGPIVTRGYVDGIDLSVGYTAGDILWLGENGAFTKTKPTAPDHLVFIGIVVRATNNGIIYVATQNGYELDELHDVSIVDKTSGDFLKYNGSLWVNDQINLGTDTVGDYVSSVTAGTGISVTFTPSEGAGASVSLNATLDNLSDVTAPSPVDKSTLVWDAYTSQWVANSQELTLGEPGTTDYLTINATSGLGNSTSTGEVFSVGPGGLVATDGTGGPFVNLNANNVTFSNGTDQFMIDPYWGTSGQVLAFTPGFGSGGTWGPTTPTLDFLSDVSAASPSAGNVLTYNGSAWTAASAASGGSTVTASTTPPASPTSGSIWFDSSTAKTYVYYDSFWVEIGGTSGGAKMYVSETAPSSPLEGQLWFKSDTAQTFAYYDSFWVEVGAAGMAAIAADAAPASPVTGQLWFNSSTGGTYVYYDSAWIEVGAHTSNTILNLVDAKGDLLVGTADNTLARQSVGTNGQLLQANSSATNGLEWVTPTYAPLASPTFTGSVTGNPAAGTTSTGTSGFGYMGLPQNGATTGAYGVVAADAGTHIYSSATRTVTIPANGTIAMPVGSTVVFIAGPGATVTIAITTDTMYLAGAGTTGSRTLAEFGMATAVKITSTSWIISGNGLT